MDTVPVMLRGDLIQVDWVDICEDVTGDPDKAAFSRRTSYGIFWGAISSHGVPGIATTTTLDDEDLKENGYCAYPLGCILGITIIKKGPRNGRSRHKRLERTQALNPSAPKGIERIP